jgi:DNA-binding transcriptional LysR family regulator
MGGQVESLDDMILLAEVAEAGSFTVGGSRLGIPKSTASQRIAQLEGRLGLRLLNRSTRQVTLTAAGQVYLDYCRRVREEAIAATTAMGNLKAEPTGRLRITCPEITASHFMPEFLRDFAASCPGINVELIATNRPLDLLQHQIDFAFRVGLAQSQDMILRRIAAIRRLLVAAPAYIADAPLLSTPSDLDRHRCLVHDSQPEWVLTAGTRVAIRPVPSLRSDSIGFLLKSASLGAGVALLPAYVCQEGLQAGVLAPVLPDWTPNPYEMTMIFPSRENPSSAQRAFRDHVGRYDFSVFEASGL